ncbi:2-dehydropantoate 2-reductase [Asticcacaulis sp. BYS171W]|uniref:2-dehydropantoate 2-reductase n=1 Tax=Asticcacaulis aquaticus TaxID=2984212 RepID=A0ABT5HY79_9CAUL|nr:2-dehydropantoate 2-reductase [Asticcacaulis aquaticus]MDC7684785.1 2-dehydropantoate 2-reductase [Asticcacaulis aquaticus]
MTTILIIGPGAVGLSAGAALIDAGHAVTFAARQAFAPLRVNCSGEPARDLDVTVVTDPAQITPPDWVLLCVKAHQVQGAADWLNAAVGEGTRVAILQNGVEHVERVEPLVPNVLPKRIPKSVQRFSESNARQDKKPEHDSDPTGSGCALVPVVVDIPAGRYAPGVVEWRGRANLLVPDTGDGRDFCALFDGTFVSARTTEDFVTDNWLKLCVNAPGGAILALTGQPMRVFHKPGVADIALAILSECVAVGRAEGAKLPDSLIEAQMAKFMEATPDDTNSMYDDRAAGRETEWDARNAVIVRKGRKHGIPTPVSDILVPLLAGQTA